MEGLYIPSGLFTEGNLRFKIDWASLRVGSKFTVFALFYFVFEDTVFKHKPPGAYIRRGHLTKRFLRYGFEGLIFGGAYFPNFTAWGGPKTGVWLFITDFITRF